MSIKYLLVAVSLVVILANCSQDVPFVAGGYGFSVGDLHGTLQIQFFVDFQCKQYLIQVLIPKIPGILGTMSGNQ
jgi:hypothetical protein